jgi:NAD(P) transhydrogenase subunit alpha
MATVNVVGGYLVTNSMLDQFRSGDDRRRERGGGD